MEVRMPGCASDEVFAETTTRWTAAFPSASSLLATEPTHAQEDLLKDTTGTCATSADNQQVRRSFRGKLTAAANSPQFLQHVE